MYLNAIKCVPYIKGRNSYILMKLGVHFTYLPYLAMSEINQLLLIL